LKKKTKKLVLAKETVALLVDRRLVDATGGTVGWNTHSCGPEASICVEMYESQTC
jgi:hypothetical protein